MPNWKKLIVSGSDAKLKSLETSGNISGSNIFASGSITAKEFIVGSTGVPEISSATDLYISASNNIFISASSTTVSGGLTGSFSGSFRGNGEGINNVVSSSYSITASFALNAGGGTGVGFPFSGSAEITGSLTVTEDITANNTASAAHFVGDGGGLTNISVQNLSSAILENAFDEDDDGDLMPSTSNNILSVFYELDDNLDLMPRT